MTINSLNTNRFLATMGGGPSFPMLPLPSTNILANMDDRLMGLLPYDSYQASFNPGRLSATQALSITEPYSPYQSLFNPFSSFQEQAGQAPSTQAPSIYDIVPGEYRTEEICTDENGNIVAKGTPGAVCSQMQVRDAGIFDRPQLPNLPSLDEALENMRQKLFGGLLIGGLIVVGIIVLVLVIKR